MHKIIQSNRKNYRVNLLSYSVHDNVWEL